ncbi:MAG: ParB N-terminal domain-containing protein [Planctomycetes bacterium]|nr:ParB N-terminal domain-containing protein [Planctomycetota bacterium]
MARVKLAFEKDARKLPIDAILPVRTVPESVKKSQKYGRIRSSLQELGLVEPLVVYPQKGTRGQARRYILLDGHLRLDALTALGETEVLCLLSTDDEAFTYNHRVNQISAIQEHFMIQQALNNGVSEERMARALSLDVISIRRKRDLLEGICPEAVELLRNQPVRPGAIREVRRALPMRQIAMAELMVGSRNFSVGYAKWLVAMTEPEELREQDKAKEEPSLKPEDVARVERELRALETDFRRIVRSHGENVLSLVLAVGYVRRLLESAAVVKYLSRKHADLLAELERIVETTNLDADAPAEAESAGANAERG